MECRVAALAGGRVAGKARGRKGLAARGEGSSRDRDNPLRAGREWDTQAVRRPLPATWGRDASSPRRPQRQLASAALPGRRR